MTSQSKAHPRLKPVFENGARRADYDATIDLFLEALPLFQTATVGDFVAFAESVDLPGLDYKQMARVLKQKADRGELYAITVHGCYRYGLPVDGIQYERIE